MQCPICKGKGELESGKMSTQRREDMVLILLQNGFGDREIQRLVGFKSPNSITKIKKRI